MLSEKTETTLTVSVPQEMLDITNSFAYMRHYDSGVDGDGIINIAVFHPLGIVNTFLGRDGELIWEYDPDIDAHLIQWDRQLLYLAGKADEIGASYLVLEALNG